MTKMLFNSKTVPLSLLTFAMVLGRAAATCWCTGEKLGGCSAGINSMFSMEWSEAGDGVRYGSESGCKSTASQINYHPNSGSDTIRCGGGYGHCRGWSNGGCYGHLHYANSAACQRGAAKLSAMFTDDCLPKPCQNGGTCTDKVNSYTCTCKPGWSGSTCATNVNDCANNPCKNGASCSDKVNSYTCTCKPGYSGLTCSTNIDDCAAASDKNENCPIWAARKVPESECANNPAYMLGNFNPGQGNCLKSCRSCNNNGKCVDGVGKFTCACNPGYSGAYCEANIDECLPKPCQNGGTCTDLVNGFKCACKPGWSGSTCATNINECAPKPCKNGAPCSDLVNGYKCACKPGWSGSTCATNVNDCANNPCKNGAPCSDKVNGYTCACKPGWSGSTCATNINECATTPCQNGGTCADKVNSYTCTCKPGYSGSTCSVTTTITTTSATTTTYQPQMCHAVLEAAGCGSRIPIADCSVGGVHQEFAEAHCPVMCGLECTSTVTSTTTVPSTMTTTATSTPITTPTTTTTTTTTITTSTTTSGTTSSATSTTYQPQFCNGVPEVAGCGSRIPAADCSIGGVHQEFAEAQCPAMCGLECTSTVTSTTTATISSTTTLTSTTSTAWLGIHDLCDPLNDVCNQTQGLVCDHAVYTCRYRTTTATATTTAALTTTAYADDEQAAPPSASGDSGGSTNVGLYSCIGALIVLVGIVAIWRRGGRSVPAEVPMPNKRRIAGATNPMYKETHEAVGSTIKKDPPSAAVDAGMYESSYEEMGPGSEASNSRTVGNAAYEEVLGSLDNYDDHSNGNDNATYEEVVGNEDVFDSDDMEC